MFRHEDLAMIGAFAGWMTPWAWTVVAVLVASLLIGAWRELRASRPGGDDREDPGD